MSAFSNLIALFRDALQPAPASAGCCGPRPSTAGGCCGPRSLTTNGCDDATFAAAACCGPAPAACDAPPPATGCCGPAIPVTACGAKVAPAVAMRIDDAALATAAALRSTATRDDTAWRLVESLTTEIGPRLAGSEGDARAVAWAEAKLHALGFDRVWREPVRFPKWERRSERAQVLGEHARPLAVTALGGSPGGAVEAEVVRFASLAALEAAPDGSLAGRIAFVDEAMTRSIDGAGYAVAARVRGQGPSLAIRKGAVAFLMRSAGTGTHRHPHTGMTGFADGLAPVPAAALAVPDAVRLARLLERGPQRVRLALDCGWAGEATSYNVIGELRGATHPDEIVLLGAHLDSWDLGTGALDDGAGIGITFAAAHLVGRLPQRPSRTLRVVAFANEEQGLYGGHAYASRHAEALPRHVLAVEADSGAGRVLAFSTGEGALAQPALDRVAGELAPLGIAYRPGTGGPGPDLGPAVARGLPWATLQHDGSEYFDHHHCASDTLDRVDPTALRQNVAAYAVLAYLAASAERDVAVTGHAP